MKKSIFKMIFVFVVLAGLCGCEKRCLIYEGRVNKIEYLAGGFGDFNRTILTTPSGTIILRDILNIPTGIIRIERSGWNEYTIQKLGD